MFGRIASLATKAIPVVGQVVMVATVILEVATVIKKVKGQSRL